MLDVFLIVHKVTPGLGGYLDYNQHKCHNTLSNGLRITKELSIITSELHTSLN